MIKTLSVLSVLYLLMGFRSESSLKSVLRDADDPRIADFFSPNGDGHNDTFVIENIKDFPINKLFVFNRWGESVFTSEPYHNEWDGTNSLEHPLMGKVLPEGMYFYRFEYIKGDFRTTVGGKVLLKR